MNVKQNKCEFAIDILANGEGIASHASTALLAEAADGVELARRFPTPLADARAPLGRRLRSGCGRPSDHAHLRGHPPLRNLSELRAVGDQEPLVRDGCLRRNRLARRGGDLPRPRGLRCVARRPRGHGGAWASGAEPTVRLLPTSMLRSTLIEAGSDEGGTESTSKRNYGYQPMLCYPGVGDPCGREALAGALRSGNVGANTLACQTEIAREALEHLPAGPAANTETVFRIDSAGATHWLSEWGRAGSVRFSAGFDLSEPIRKAICQIPEKR